MLSSGTIAMPKPSPIDVVEAAYRLDGTDDAWLGGVLAAASPHFDRGHGVYGFWFDATDAQRFKIWGITMPGEALISPKLVLSWHEMLSARELWNLYCGTQQVAPMRDRLGDEAGILAHPAMAKFCHSLGILDQLTARATDPTYVGVAICTPLAQFESPSENQVRMWTLLAAHISAGHRLRRSLGGEGSVDTAEAVLRPDGECVHAKDDAKDADAREAFRRGIKAMDRARTGMRNEAPGHAVELWEGLIEGTWSLVDHFDSDGRRYVLARRNEPGARDLLAITPKERQVIRYLGLGLSTKEIAYALGVAGSTVTTHISSAMRKLKVESRVELVQLLRTFALQGPGADAPET